MRDNFPEIESEFSTFLKKVSDYQNDRVEQKVSVTITVNDYDRMGKNEAIGKLTLGCHASGSGTG